jgi:methylase of polypeptide subunit release factors
MSYEIASVAEVVPNLCHGHAKFTDGTPVHTFAVQGEHITLRHHPDVFPPSAFGLKFANHVDFDGCRRAADIGTGTGLLAILAAKKGVPEIMATDVSSLAIGLAQKNAREMNAIDGIEMRQGHFFSDLDGVFDVITANLPQEILPPTYHAGLSRLQSQAIEGGGAGGNAILLEFLDLAPRYMHAETRLYVIVNTVTDYKRTLQKINSSYHAKLVWEGATSTKKFVAENIAFFRQLIEAGTVSLIAGSDGNWRAHQYIYQLALKS